MTTKPTAAEAYAQAALRINDQLEALDRMAEALHDKDPGAVNWGHVGDLERVQEALNAAILAFEVKG